MFVAFVVGALSVAGAAPDPSETAPAAPAAPPVPTPADTNESPSAVESTVAAIDRAHDSVASGLVHTVADFDRFFGFPPVGAESTTLLRLQAGVKISDIEGTENIREYSLHLGLPALQDRLQIVVDNLMRDEDEPQFEERLEPFEDEREDTEAALRYLFLPKERWRLSADIGLRISEAPQVLLRVRGRYDAPFEYWHLRVAQRVQWFSRDGFSATSLMRWTRPITRRWLFGSYSVVKWEDDRNGVTPNQSFGAVYGDLKRVAHRIGVGGQWPETPHTREAAYAVEYSFRCRLWRPWFFIEVRPGIAYQQPYDYQANPYIVMLAEVNFGEL